MNRGLVHLQNQFLVCLTDIPRLFKGEFETGLIISELAENGNGALEMLFLEVELHTPDLVVSEALDLLLLDVRVVLVEEVKDFVHQGEHVAIPLIDRELKVEVAFVLLDGEFGEIGSHFGVSFESADLLLKLALQDLQTGFVEHLVLGKGVEKGEKQHSFDGP